MRYAIITDIHGNTHALDAIFADIDQRGDIDQYLFLGDYCGIGYDPVGVLERIVHLPNAHFIRGNVDRYVAFHQSPEPSIEAVEANPKLATALAEVQRGFGWTSGAIMQASKTGNFDYWSWLQNLPLEYRFEMQNGKQALCVHASPDDDNSEGLYPEQSDDVLRGYQQGAQADLILVGHTHVPHQRTVDDVHWVNVGSAGNPLQSNLDKPDLRACYGILDTGHDGYAISMYRVEYDVQAVIEAFSSWDYPSRAYPLLFYHGRKMPNWL